jgi:hypothetical protein
MTLYGEVVRADSGSFTVQAYQLDLLPALGSIVRVGPAVPDNEDPFAAAPTPSGSIFGLVTGATSGSVDPGRRALAAGMPLEELRRRQPHLFELLRRDVECIVIGYCDALGLQDGYPPNPAHIHEQVWAATDDEIRCTTHSGEFLRGLFNSETPMDEAAAAAVRTAADIDSDPACRRVQLGRQLSILLKGDTVRLAGILRRLKA